VIEPFRTPPLWESVLARLREAILGGELPAGTKLVEVDLAERFGMSRGPIREAIRELERLGLAEHVPHRGARVAQLTIEDLRDTYEARLALESLAVRHAAERCVDEEVALAQRLLDDHVEAYRRGDDDRGRALHAEFHFAVYAASRSQWLPRLIRPLWENSERYRIASLRAGRPLERRRREHQRILDAVAGHEPDAAVEALRAHLVTTANLVARRMGHEALF